MIVLSLSSCPLKIRGYLTAWFFEISTGVFVGNVSARVRDEVWKIVTENIGSGRAIMAYSANNEQKMSFATWNTGFIPVDYDGIRLVKRTDQKNEKRSGQKSDIPIYFGLEHYLEKNALNAKRKSDNSSAGGAHKSKTRRTAPNLVHLPITDYTVIDLETGGLDCASAPIIEIGAIKVRNRQPVDNFHRLIRIDSQLDSAIIKLTGISDELLQSKGVPIEEAMNDFLAFTGNDVIAGHNVRFDLSFLKYACNQMHISEFSPAIFDSWILSKRVIPDLPSYRLSELLKRFNIAGEQRHRALEDAELTYKLIEKLNEIR